MQNLQKEGFGGTQIASAIFNSGDLMLDAFRYFDEINKEETNAWGKEPYLLATIHRRQNIEEVAALAQIIEALNVLHAQVPVVCPLHPNTRQVLESNGIKCLFSLLPPQGYLPMQRLIRGAHSIITDSGGVQREAFFAQKPTLILMEKPFWPEVVLHGNALPVASRKEAILQQYENLEKLQKPFDSSLFGDGNAAGKIAEEIIRFAQSLKENLK